jgi:hypothetical protein
MGRKRAPAQDPGPLELDDEPDEPEVDEEDAQDIEGVISQIDDDEATVTVKRRDPDDPSGWSYLTAMPARAFSLEKIKQEYGGGEYKAFTVDRQKRLIKGVPRLFRIDKIFKPRPPVAATPEARPGVAPEILALAAKVDQLANVVAAQNSSRETLDYALKIAAVLRGAGGGGGPGLGANDVFGIFEKGLEFSRKLNGGGDGDERDGGDAFDVALKELVKPVARLLETEVERRARIRPGAPPAAGAAPSTAALPPAGGGEPMPATAPSWLVRLKPFIPQFVALARDGANPTLYADVLVDVMDRKLTAAEVAGIEEEAQNPAFVDTVLAALPPSCAPHGEWFRALLTALQTRLTAEEEKPA